MRTLAQNRQNRPDASFPRKNNPRIFLRDVGAGFLDWPEVSIHELEHAFRRSIYDFADEENRQVFLSEIAARQTGKSGPNKFRFNVALASIFPGEGALRQRMGWACLIVLGMVLLALG